MTKGVILISYNKKSIKENMKKVKKLSYFIIQKYIEKNYIEVKEPAEHKIRFSLKSSFEQKEKKEEASVEEVENFKLDNKVLYENISNFIEKRAESTFVENLLRLILQSGKKDSRVYKDAGVDRRLFSKMISNYNYRPSKDTVLAFALSLELNLEQSKELLSSAGYSLSNSDKRDVILTFCFERGIYKMKQVNEILYVFREKTF